MQEKLSIPDAVAEGYALKEGWRGPGTGPIYNVPEAERERFPSYHVIRQKQELIRELLGDPEALGLLGVTAERAKLFCEAEIKLFYAPEAKKGESSPANIHLSSEDNAIRLILTPTLEHDSPETRDRVVSHEMGHFLKTDHFKYRLQSCLYHTQFKSIQGALGAVLGDEGISGMLKSEFANLCYILLQPLRAGMAVLHGYLSRQEEFTADRIADFISESSHKPNSEMPQKTGWVDFLKGKKYPTYTERQNASEATRKSEEYRRFQDKIAPVPKGLLDR